ncbi:MAG: DUF262 domain-containing protein, partial [Synergistaceae bacterium]|nr:DUF262 domain-containing protein [Synergistaceae bacterium]
MKIELHRIPIREIVEGYRDMKDDGVVGYGGRLNIRPAFQREFIYSDTQRRKVIESIMKDFPLNVMYWVINSEGNYEMLDGQQRTISICQYAVNDFAIDNVGYVNLTKAKQEKFMNYELMIYFCEGTDDETLDWFEIINIAGEKLTSQESRNAIYSGTWLTDAKEHFSRTNCAAYADAKNYMKGSAMRQEYLETAIRWAADHDGISDKSTDKVVREYMRLHQHDKDCGELWLYFQSVMNWVRHMFPVLRSKVMNRVQWGLLYNLHGSKSYNPGELEAQIKALMEDDDVTNKAGIYEYVLDGETKHLSIRKFSDSDKRAAYERQNGICAVCGKHFELKEMEADHITPWSRGGRTEPDNCQMLCRE